ncbi:MAG TPA: Crp/Fnr family transcriptional regulator [Caulobacteraceae bacterium]|nr:Crp/Fnr family transcriptional regulator [Caulobacteraceae bacterium]
MAELLIRKLENFVTLSSDDKKALIAVARERVRSYEPKHDIICEGDQPRWVNLILEGYAYRYRMLEDGRRQIVGLFFPGDLCDSRMFILRHMDHSLGALTKARVAEIDPDRFIELADSYPRITRALWWNTLVEEAIAREWIVNVGQRSARERMAHLLCEIYMRMDMVGLAQDHTLDLPMNQTELSEALGLSVVHTNRTLQALRSDGLITLRGGKLVIRDLDGLMQAGMFNSVYLHLDREGHALDANEGQY